MSEVPAHPVAAPPESERRRVLRLGILGCGTALLVLMVLASIVGYVVAHHPRQFRSALGAVFTTLEDEIERNFAPEVTPDERKEFRAARERFHEAWNAGRIDMTAADRLRRRLMQESRKDRMTPEDVESLTRFLDALAREAPRPLTRSAGSSLPCLRQVFPSIRNPEGTLRMLLPACSGRAPEGVWGMPPPGQPAAWGILPPDHPAG